MAVVTQPAGVTNRPASGFWHTRWMLVGYYVLALLWGLRNIRQDKPSNLDLIVPLAMALVLSWWVVVDARLRRHPIPLLAQPWFFLLFGLAVPGYVVWSRRWRGVGWVVLHAVLWYILVVITMIAGWSALYGGAQPDAAVGG